MTLVPASSHSAAGAAALTEHTVTLAAANILALNLGFDTTPTPSSGYMFVPMQCLFAFQFGTVPFTAADPNQLVYVSTRNEFLVQSNGGSYGQLYKSGMLTFNFDSTCLMVPTDDVSFLGADGHPLCVISNSPFTGGDGELTVVTWYATVPVPT